MIRTKLLYPKSWQAITKDETRELDSQDYQDGPVYKRRTTVHVIDGQAMIEAEYPAVVIAYFQNIADKNKGIIYHYDNTMWESLDVILDRFFVQKALKRENLIDIKYDNDSENGASALVIWDDGT